MPTSPTPTSGKKKMVAVKQRWPIMDWRLVGFLVALSVVGLVALQLSRAATENVPIESEGALIYGAAANTNDDQDSGGHLLFSKPGPRYDVGVSLPCQGVQVSPGDDIQTKVNANAEGATFCLAAGVYNQQSVMPKNNQSFIGTGRVILNGSRLLTVFQRLDELWFATGQTQQGIVHGTCMPDAPRCNRPEDLFINDALQVHVDSLAAVRPGYWYFDYAADRVYIGEDPAGKKIEVGLVPQAFGGRADGVKLKNIIVEKYANRAQFGAIHGSSGSVGWQIERVIARKNHGIGIAIKGARGSIIRDSTVRLNGQMGMGGQGVNSLVEYNEIANNNAVRYLYGWEGGGFKFTYHNGISIRHNYVHNNFGPGLWTDINNRNVLYEYNVAESNFEAGIFHEISYEAIIRYNTLRNNGNGNPRWCYGAGIQVSASKNVEVHNNLLENNGQGIVGIVQDRGNGPDGLPYTVTDLYVHHNLIRDNQSNGHSRNGVCRDNTYDVYSNTANNRFRSNVYVGPNVKWAAWNGRSVPSFSTWQSLGQDLDGSYSPNN